MTYQKNRLFLCSSLVFSLWGCETVTQGTNQVFAVADRVPAWVATTYQSIRGQHDLTTSQPLDKVLENPPADAQKTLKTLQPRLLEFVGRVACNATAEQLIPYWAPADFSWIIENYLPLSNWGFQQNDTQTLGCVGVTAIGQWQMVNPAKVLFQIHFSPYYANKDISMSFMASFDKKSQVWQFLPDAP